MNSLRGAVRRRWWIENAPGTRDGMGISGLDWGGDKPIALLHHANGFCAATLAPFAQRLTPHYRVIAVDARGQGDSDVPLLPEGTLWQHFADDLAAVARQILDETGGERIDYAIGSSFGGTASALAEARHPGTFARIAMLDPPINFGESRLEASDIDASAAESRRPSLIELARKRRSVWPSREVVRQAWRDKSTFLPWNPEAFDLYVDQGFRDLTDGSVALKCSPDVEAAVFEASAVDPRLFEPLRTVACPVLLVHAGRGDFSMQIHEHFAGFFQNCQLQVADIGHLMPCEDPELSAELVLQFAAQQPSTASSTTSIAASASIS